MRCRVAGAPATPRGVLQQREPEREEPFQEVPTSPTPEPQPARAGTHADDARASVGARTMAKDSASARGDGHHADHAHASVGALHFA